MRNSKFRQVLQTDQEESQAAGKAGKNGEMQEVIGKQQADTYRVRKGSFVRRQNIFDPQHAAAHAADTRQPTADKRQQTRNSRQQTAGNRQ
jgi:hypothetical protein